MSVGKNHVSLIGNLGQPPELRYTTSGTAVCEMRLATNYRYKDGADWKEGVEWHTVIVWGKKGEWAKEALHKGDRIGVDGRIETKTSEKDGQKRYFTKIVAEEIFAFRDHGGEQREAPRGAGNYREERFAAKPDQDPNNGAETLGTGGPGPDDDLPF